MSNERLLQPIKADYTHALGLTTFCFAICEWNAANCAERISPGALNKIVGEEMTAGTIAKKLLNHARSMPPSKQRAEVIDAAQAFAELVPLRNSIMHGKPCTGPIGEARLSASSIFEIADLEAAADEFSKCSIELNRLLHGFLATYPQALNHKDS